MKKLISGIKEYFLWLAIFSMFICMLPTTSAGASSQRYYAGYYYGGAKWGVTAKIYTIDASIPFWNGYAEWITVIISYSYEYFIQLGYFKQWKLWIERNFYVETKSAYGYQQKKVDGKPEARHTYTYVIAHAQKADPELWRVTIREGAQELYSGEVRVKPYEPEDLQAFVETTTTKICIDGSHFSDICYFDGRSWPYWDKHLPRADSPYYLYEVSHHEFDAHGGG